MADPITPLGPLSLAQIAAIEATARQAMRLAVAVGPLTVTDGERGVSRTAVANAHGVPIAEMPGMGRFTDRTLAAHLAACSPEVILSLCQMARPKTCADCQYNIVEREDLGVVVCGLMADSVFRAAHPEMQFPWQSSDRPMFNPDGTRHGCSLHEARQGQET